MCFPPQKITREWFLRQREQTLSGSWEAFSIVNVVPSAVIEVKQDKKYKYSMCSLQICGTLLLYQMIKES